MRPDVAYSEDSEGRRRPVFDTDVHPHQTPDDLDPVRDPDDPSDAGGGVVDVFGRLPREQEPCIDRYEVRAQDKAHGPVPGTARGAPWRSRRVTEGGKP